MQGPAMDEIKESKVRMRKRQRVGLLPAAEVDFSIAYPFSDVKLVSASGAVLYGSRYTLAVRSPVCKQMLLSGMKEAQPLAMSDMVTIPFPGMRTEALQVLLEFCIAGCFSEEQVRETPVDVLHAARYFQLTDDMEELVGSVIEKLPLAGVGSELGGMLAEMLSLALECLPADLEASFFEVLLKKICSRSLSDLPYAKLSSQALEFVLSKTLQGSEPWGFPFHTCEYDIFHYVLRWSGHQVSEDVQQRLEKLLKGIQKDKGFDIEKCAPGTAEMLEKVATIARPFCPLVDFKLIHPKRIAQEIEPLEIVPTKMLFAALCHHAKSPNLRPPSLYRGPNVLQWSPDACGSGFTIDEYADDVGLCKG